MVNPAGIGIHTGCQQLGQGSEGCARSDHPTPKAGMDIPDRVGEDIPAELLIYLLRCLRINRQRLVKMSLNQVGGM